MKIYVQVKSSGDLMEYLDFCTIQGIPHYRVKDLDTGYTDWYPVSCFNKPSRRDE